MSGPIDAIKWQILEIRRNDTDLNDDATCDRVENSELANLIQNVKLLCLSILDGSFYKDQSQRSYKADDLSVALIEGIPRFSYPDMQEFVRKHKIPFNPECNLPTDHTDFKVPAISHAIWVPRVLRLPDNRKTEIFKSKIRQLDSESGVMWTHILWVNKFETELRTYLNNSGLANVETRSIKKLNMTQKIKSVLYRLLDNDRYAAASDIIRLLVLKDHGGVYSDIDCNVVADTRCVREKYSFFIPTRTSAWPFNVESNFIGAVNSSVVILKALNLIERNFSPNKPVYLALPFDYTMQVISGTGPNLVTLAFIKSSIENDVVLDYCPYKYCRKTNSLSVDEAASNWMKDNHLITGYFDDDGKYISQDDMNDFKWEIMEIQRNNPELDDSAICDQVNNSDFAGHIPNLENVCRSILDGSFYKDYSKRSYKEHDFGIPIIEGIPEFSYSRMQEFVRKHKIPFNPECNLPTDHTDFKVPAISHAIWVPRVLRLPDNRKTEIFKSKIRQLDSESGVMWTHILWVNKFETELRTYLNNSGLANVETRSIKKLNMTQKIKSVLYRLLDNDRYAAASDIIRLLVLKDHGGVYSDIDCNVVADTRCVREKYSFFIPYRDSTWHLDSTWPINVESNFIGAVNNSNITLKALSLIERNFSPDKPIYLTQASDFFMQTLISTGPTLVTIVFIKSAKGMDVVLDYCPYARCRDINSLSIDEATGDWKKGKDLLPNYFEDDGKYTPQDINDFKSGQINNSESGLG